MKTGASPAPYEKGINESRGKACPYP